MKLRRQFIARVGIIIMILIGSGCSLGKPGQPDQGDPKVIPPAPLAVAPGQPPNLSGEFAFPVHLAPDSMKQVPYNSSQEITQTGVYNFDVSSGKVESWQLIGSAPEVRTPLFFSADGRWVTAWGETKDYMTLRSVGTTHAWERLEVQMLANDSERLLFAGKGERKGIFWVTDAEFKPLYAFRLDLGQREAESARFAPDGKSIAISSGLWPNPEGQADAQVDLVDLATGKSRALTEQPEEKGGLVIGQILTGSPASTDLLVNFTLQYMESTGISHQRSALYRYDWTGHLLAKYVLPGQVAAFSPDGRLISINQNLDYLATAAVVIDLATGKPQFRVVWAGSLDWLADSSSLLIHSDCDSLVVSTAGALGQALRPPITETYARWSWPVPSPSDPNRFANGMAIFDGSGQIVREIKLPKNDSWIPRNTTWSSNGKELVFNLLPRMGQGDGCNDSGFPLPPKVQRPPFPEKFILQVKDPGGECLNLRASYSVTSPVIRCLPSGTKLAIGDLTMAPIKLNRPLWSNEDMVWMWVQTEQAEQGWVSAATDSVTWAD